MLSVYFVAAAYVERAWFGYKYLILFLQSFFPFLRSAKGTFLEVLSVIKMNHAFFNSSFIDIIVEKIREDLMFSVQCIVSLT